jgi:hypothetical protein
MLDYSFTEKRRFVPKTGRSSVFLYHESHIPDQLYIIVVYIGFYGFLKNLNFGSKYKGVSLRFYPKIPVRAKNLLILRIS